MKDKKSPRGIKPRRCSPSPQVAIYIIVTQDTSPSDEAEVCDQYLFGRTKTGSLGQESTKKKQKALDLAVVLPPFRMQNILRSLKIRALACVAKDPTNICLAERNRRSGASDHEKKGYF